MAVPLPVSATVVPAAAAAALPGSGQVFVTPGFLPPPHRLLVLLSSPLSQAGRQSVRPTLARTIEPTMSHMCANKENEVAFCEI